MPICSCGCGKDVSSATDLRHRKGQASTKILAASAHTQPGPNYNQKSRPRKKRRLNSSHLPPSYSTTSPAIPISAGPTINHDEDLGPHICQEGNVLIQQEVESAPEFTLQYAPSRTDTNGTDEEDGVMGGIGDDSEEDDNEFEEEEGEFEPYAPEPIDELREGFEREMASTRMYLLALTICCC